MEQTEKTSGNKNNFESLSRRLDEVYDELSKQ